MTVDSPGHEHDRGRKAAPLAPPRREQPPERVGRDREQVVTQREQLPSRGRLAAQRVLRDQGVDDDDDRVDGRKKVDRPKRGTAAHGPRRKSDAEKQQRFLPGRDDVERRAAHAEVPELRHGRVVERKPDHQGDEREGGEPLRERLSQRSPPTSARG